MENMSLNSSTANNQPKTLTEFLEIHEKGCPLQSFFDISLQILDWYADIHENVEEQALVLSIHPSRFLFLKSNENTNESDKQSWKWTIVPQKPKVNDGKEKKTSFGLLMENLRYLAPEYLSQNGESMTIQMPQSKQKIARDMYAFGILCYQFLVGHLPFDNYLANGQDLMSIVHFHRTKVPDAVKVDSSDELNQLIMNLLTKMPQGLPHLFYFFCSGVAFIKIWNLFREMHPNLLDKG